MQNTLYREEILEHYRQPLNFGTLSPSDKSSRQLNPFCGDEIAMSVKFAGNKVSEIMFDGAGCAISVAASSILTDFAKGKTKSQLTKMSDYDMLKLLGVDVSETRKKCALLGFSVLKDCLV
ncbi:MAG TPA: iron-sulfur cluster assembly scaffold protein [Candidatus Saccharimonadales bacterium]|nr:iron-sulfur cluster assembly scaffold protein [Candidatus Saccharimonadales bacterium]